MKKSILTGALAFGLFLSGFSAANYFRSLDVTETRDAPLTKLPELAEALSRRALVDGASAPQVTQVQSEVQTHLAYMQVRQNAEIIRLLTELNKKK